MGIYQVVTFQSIKQKSFFNEYKALIKYEIILNTLKWGLKVNR